MAKATNPTKTSSAAAAAPGEEPQPAPARDTKLGRIRALLAAPEGASLPTLCDATGWQAQSVRAALTVLRKAGAPIEKSRGEDGAAIYRIGVGAGETEGAKAHASVEGPT